MAIENEDSNGPLQDTFEDTNTSYLAYLEGRGAKKAHLDPTGAKALEVQAEDLHELGDQQHPVDVLRRISLNPWVSPRDRIAASKALLEYTAAKMPTRIDQVNTETKTIEIDNKALKNLSSQELDQMIKLLDKANSYDKM